jgi:hypothetical protein
VNQSPGMNEREGVADLTDAQIMEILRTTTRDELYQLLTYKRHPDGITVPTFAAQWLAKEFRAAAPAPSAWQPIETAPKDGTEILVTREGNGLLTRIVKWAAKPTEDYSEQPTDPRPSPPLIGEAWGELLRSSKRER